MILTEEEARKKWCPFARDILSAGGNRAAYGGAGAEPDSEECHEEYEAEMADQYPCLASACMAWRRVPIDDMRERELWSKSQNKRVSSATGDDGEWRLVNPDEPAPPARGFCGLAGRQS